MDWESVLKHDPPQGHDCVPELPKPKPKDTLSDLGKLLQQANEREDALKRDNEHFHRAYNSLNQEYWALLRQKRDRSRYHWAVSQVFAGETTHSLMLKLEKACQEICYWQEYYETLLSEHYDRRMIMVPAREFEHLTDY